MPQLRAFTEYFEEHPPLHLIVAAFGDVKPRYRRGQGGSAATATAFESLLASSATGHKGASDGPA